MLRKAFRLFFQDRKAFRWHVKRKLLEGWCRRFARSGFYCQGKMDLDPRSWWHNPEFVAASGGFFVPNDPVPRRLSELEPYDFTRRDMIVLLLRELVEKRIAGDLAEVGVYKGSTARLIHHYLPERKFYLFDTFAGFAAEDVQAERSKTGLKASSSTFSDTSVQLVLANIAPQNGNIQVFPGYFPQSAPDFLQQCRFAFVNIDADLYEPILASLRFFYDKLTPGGFLLVHDYNSWPGARRAVREFFQDKPEIPIPMPDKSGSALVAKLGLPSA